MGKKVGELSKEVGARLRRARVIQRITLDGARIATGLSINTLSRIESGKGKVTVEILAALSVALGIPVDTLFDDLDHGAVRALPSRKKKKSTEEST